MPLKEFFQTAREKEKNGMESLQLFFLMNLRLLRPDRVLDAYKKWKDEYGIGNLDDGEAVNQIRLVSVGFQIKDSHLSHRHDLLCLSDHIKGVFKLYDNIDERKLHLGPYFCFVQSSGMGKTKLLYEYKRISSADHVASFLIVPKASIEKDSKENKDVFDFYLDLKLPKAEANTMLANARKAAESIFTYLDGMVKELIRKKKRKS